MTYPNYGVIKKFSDITFDIFDFYLSKTYTHKLVIEKLHNLKVKNLQYICLYPCKIIKLHT